MYIRRYLAVRNAGIAIGALFAVGIGVVSYVAYASPAAYPPIGSNQEEMLFWEDVIEKKGGKAAYADLLVRYKDQTLQDGHTFAHMFGIALYSVEGVKGFSSCGYDFVWGCFHSFIERAIAANGITIIDTLNEYCNAMPREDIQECHHALGHGILSFLGPDKLVTALDMCTQLARVTWGCWSGTIMELLDGNIHERRAPLAYSEATRYGPCPALPEKYKPVCYRRIPDWWGVAIRTDTPDERLAREQKNCSEVSEQRYRTACFIGVGYNEASYTSFDVEESRGVCMKIHDAEDRNNCFYGAALSAFQNTPTRDRAAALCPVGVTLPECITYSERVMGGDEATMAFPQ